MADHGGKSHPLCTIDVTKAARRSILVRWALCAVVVMSASEIVSSLVETVREGLADPFFLRLVWCAPLLAFGFAGYAAWSNVAVLSVRSPRLLLLSFLSFIHFGSLEVLIGSLDLLTPAGGLVVHQAATVMFADGMCISSVGIIGVAGILLVARTRLSGVQLSVSGLIMAADEAARSAGPAVRAPAIRSLLGITIAVLGFTYLAAIDVVSDELFLRLPRVVAILLSTPAWALLLQSRSMFRPDFSALVASDRRPPILFLRSFKDDARVTDRMEAVFIDPSLEARLGAFFGQFGPFIGVGAPGDREPRVGAARALLGDGEWQPRVEEWIRSASAIVMFAGTTPSVNWELEKVLGHGRALNLILIFPETRRWFPWTRRKDAARRLACLRDDFAPTRWSEGLAAVQDPATIRTLSLTAEGGIVVVRSRSRSRESYHLAAMIAHHLQREAARELPAASTAHAA